MVGRTENSKEPGAQNPGNQRLARLELKVWTMKVQETGIEAGKPAEDQDGAEDETKPETEEEKDDHTKDAGDDVRVESLEPLIPVELETPGGPIRTRGSVIVARVRMLPLRRHTQASESRKGVRAQKAVGLVLQTGRIPRRIGVERATREKIEHVESSNREASSIDVGLCCALWDLPVATWEGARMLGS